MSRSYKKNPYYKDHNRGMKQCANRTVRNTFDVPNGNAYKKVFCSYDISDYSFHESWKSRRRQYEQDLQTYLNGGERRCRWHDSLPNEEDYSYHDWYKTYRMK